MPEDLAVPSSLSASIENSNINNDQQFAADPCFRIEPYPNSCACLDRGCASLRSAAKIEEWDARDRNRNGCA